MFSKPKWELIDRACTGGHDAKPSIDLDPFEDIVNTLFINYDFIIYI